ncbi:tetratricopeptide repeat protein [Lentisalinibacter salinarum]|uniref:tetratricopeptide repeat protein n=1 Tax=Lentisalinibacter salinarum TaxID=2992239 RepID=UPI00386692FC
MTGYTRQQRSRSSNRRINATGVMVILSIWMLPTLLPVAGAQTANQLSECGELNNAYGPFDYTNAEHRREKLPIVERFHFNDEVFRLERGLTSGNPTGDIAYTLHAFPNHHRALDAMARLHRKHQTEKLPGARYSLACYFDRARRMAPHDATIPMLQGIHFFKTGRMDQAEISFQVALDLAPNSAEIHYNLGLLYIREGNFEYAREHAVRAYELGFPLPGLRRKLIDADQWPTSMDDS